MEKNRYMIRLYTLYHELEQKGVKRIVSKLIEKGYWESQGTAYDQQFKTGVRKSDEWINAVEKLNILCDDERE